jgi:hypothetical protein
MKNKTEIFELNMLTQDTSDDYDCYYQPISLHSTYESARAERMKFGDCPLDYDILQISVYLSETEKEKVLDKSYFDLGPIRGVTILKYREYVLNNNTFNVARIYRDIEIDPDKWYIASIIWDDISPITSHYIEEIIIEPVASTD